MESRRDFLTEATLLALAPGVPAFLARTARAAAPARDGRVLVVVQLSGGNDGLNTLVPFADEGYARGRKELRLPAAGLVRVAEGLGLHPALADAARLLDAGRLAVVQGVGYPNPSRSHFESLAVWHSARREPAAHGGAGWLGTALGAVPAGGGAAPALFVGGGAVPAALTPGRRGGAGAPALEDLGDFTLTSEIDPRRAIAPEPPSNDLRAFVRRTLLDGYTTAARLGEAAPAAGRAPYPRSRLGERLRLVAGLLKADFGARVYYTAQPGYDTHFVQLPAHAALLGELGSALRAFLDDLRAAKLEERVAVLCFSEFGRRVAENGSLGTDHGTAGPVFLAGGGVKAGLVGDSPSASDLVEGDLKAGLDFRQVYASVLEDWLDLPAGPALGGKFKKLPLFRL